MTTTGTWCEALPKVRQTWRVRAGATGSTSEDSRAPGAPPALPQSSPPRLPRNLKGVSILVVDDDESTLELFSAALTHCGARVTTAIAAADALAAVAQARPDVVLSDIAMPTHDGYWLLAEIRKLDDARLREVPVVAATAYGRVHSRERTEAAGFVAHVSKPVDPETLCRAIAGVLGR
jgi:CheY-like chemotaxis protein